MRYLRDYVSIPSVNPMGREDIDPEIAGEQRYAEHMRHELRRIGLDAELIEGDGRPTVLAEARTRGTAETLLIESHLDTVPVDGMEIDPFDPRIEAGRLYGRGACDTKAGMACAFEALERVLARGSLRRNVILAGAADEEFGSLGVRALIEQLGGRPPDWAIATEPTRMQIVTGHKGIVLAYLEASGVAGHSSDPARGRNAIVAAARAILALDQLSRDLRAKTDPALGHATLSIGIVTGGSAPNIIPHAAEIVLDRRVLPGESADLVRAEIEACLAEQNLDDVRIRRCSLEKDPLVTPDHHASVVACRAALAGAGYPALTTTAAFGTDAGVLAAARIPTVVLVPGSIEQAHTAREWVDLAEVEAMVGVFERIFEGAGA